MKSKPVFLSVVVLILILSGCSPFTVTSSSGQQPTPMEEFGSPATGYQPVQVDQIEVEVGVGSPIPIQVTVTGDLPDSCAQIELVQQKQEGSHFEITISAIPSSAEGCVPDTLPFRMVIPLNITNLPAGSYSVEANGVGTDFQLETGNTTSSRPAANTVIRKDDIQVDSVNVEIGVGSPIPVHAIVSLSLPNSCAQLGEIRLHREETTFYMRLIADIAERPDCREDSIPFRLDVPLNIVNLPEGPYEVNVNGVTASFDRRTGNPGEQACTNPVDVPLKNGNVSYNGISFDLDPALASVVTAQTCPAAALSTDQAPGEAHPPYTAFSFPDYSRENTDFQPEIRVYELTGDLQQYLFPINSIADLQAVIDERPEPITWLNASPLHARQAYLDFGDGAGVRGLVQYMQDFFFFTNNGLLYEFHGLTQDGLYFVHVRYPVSVPFLMELADPVTLPPANVNPQAIPIPEWPSDFEQQREVIEAYNAEALTRLEQMADSDPRPSLALLDALVQSIQVDKP